MKRCKFFSHSAVKFFLLILLAGTVSISNGKPVSELALNSSWQFRKSGDKDWLPATVPGTVHTDLLTNKKIPDPFWGTNEKELQWIEDADWEYQIFFSVEEKNFNQAHIEIEFKGLDTYAKVFLNDSLILAADNMFRRWNIDVKKYLKKKNNHLLVRFESAVQKGKTLAKQLPYTLPGDEKIYTRKAQYQYGWDWGPRFVTCGIWKNVSLIVWNDLKIESIQMRQEPRSDSLTVMHLVVEVHSDINRTLTFLSTDLAQEENHLAVSIGKDTEIHRGFNKVELSFPIHYPKTWWCNGIGNPFLYNYSISAGSGKKNLDETKITFGLRMIELVQEKDSIGKSFYFKLNGIPVFMKGANWIPADNFIPRVSKEKYRELLLKAKEANINMLRVWGGGVYESDDFYAFCDSLGILVWQDFMFACAMYPGDPAFVNNVREEVRENVKRLRNHPCIALWCGNNEIDEGWKNWGWQKQFHYSKNDSTKIYADYKNLFGEIIPEIVASEDVSRSYWESSPSIGWGHKESLEQGDSHYWGVWWGMEPFENYTKKIGRFVSEYGFQGMPSFSTFKKNCYEKDLSLTSDAVKSHQKHPAGYETIQKYLERDYKQPKDFENYIYVSQLMQAQGMKTAIEAHRMAKSRCMGTLYWQFNDCWPATSWSSIDYYGHQKALYYFTEKAFEKYFICAEMKDNNLVVNVIADDTADVQAMFKLKLMDFTGNILWKDSGSVFMNKEKSNPFYPLPLADMLNGISEFRTLFKMELMLKGKIVSENAYYFVEPKQLLLDKKDILYSIHSGSNNSYSISLYTTSLAKNVCIDFEGLNVLLSDNFFDLFPKEQKVISIVSDMPVQTLKEKIRIQSLVDSY